MANGNRPRYGRYRNAGVGDLLLLAFIVLALGFGLRACVAILNYDTTRHASSEEPLELQVASSAPKKKSVQNQRLRGVIFHVSDGDTADFRPDNGGELRLRFFGIDAPESGQEYGPESRRFTTNCLLRQHVEIIPRYEDPYGRTVATIYLDGKDFCLELIARGYAWHWARYYDSPEYARAMKQAQAAKIGLWGAAVAAGHAAVPPWEFRKSHPRRSKNKQN